MSRAVGLSATAPTVRRGLASAVLASAALAVVVAAAVPAARIVAVGDVHGSPEGLRAILEVAGIVDGSGHWAGGDAVLVQTGDVFDRGVAVCEDLELLMRLEREARSAGGEVVCLLGNHEAMNLHGNLRDVAPALLAAFADAASEQRRSRAVEDYVGCRHRLAELIGQPPPATDDELRGQWLASHPPGTLEYLEALGPDGRYGRWLRGLPAVAVRGDTLFVHGGVSPNLDALDVATINRRVAEEIATFDGVRGALAEAGLALPTASLREVTEVARLVTAAAATANGRRGARLGGLAAAIAGFESLEHSSITSRDGPLWYRGAALGDDDEVAAVLAVVGRLGAERLVVGHTSQDDGRIGVRAGGRVLLIDTGMLEGEFYPGGRPAVLELCGREATAIYPDGRFLLGDDGGWLAAGPAAASIGEPALAASGGG